MEMGIEMGMGMGFNNGGNIGSYPSSSSFVTENSMPFAALLDKHKREVDLYLHYQGEKLKEAVQQQKRQQMQYLLQSFESRTMVLMKQKDEQLEKQKAKTKLLEQYLKKSEEEAVAWQSIAKEKEETALELNNLLRVIQQNLPYGGLKPNNNVANNGDAESVNEYEAIDKRENEEVKSNNNSNNVVCKWCKNGKLCVVFLPCKHLCCCKGCESALELCPVCYSAKQGNLEILFP